MYKDHETPRFWLSYGEAIKCYVEKRVADKTAVNDILHDVYLKIFCYCRRYDFCCEKAGVKNLRSWIFGICHNAVVDHQKQKARYSLGLEEKEVADFSGSKNDDTVGLKELMKLLPSKYAEAIWYDSVLHLKQAEIASKLGLSLSATKSRIQRGKKMFRAMYIQQLQK
jgi:RNA polymerase sigma-70 factor (ECF subfamily)